MLKLDSLRFQQRVDQIENVETDSPTVNLCEYVADFGQRDVTLQFDIRNLILLNELSDIIAERLGIGGMGFCLGIPFNELSTPVCLIPEDPIVELEASFANDRDWK